MCGFKNATKAFTGGRLFPFFIFQVLYWIGRILTFGERPTLMRVFNGGSFLNPREIPIRFQNWLFKQIRQHPTIRTIYIESRAEYVGSERIRAIKNILQSKALVIGIGLECKNDYIRNTIINKGLSRELYETTIKLLQSFGVKILTYVFLKPIDISEKKAIEEAIDTAKYAFNIGSDLVALESAFVQEDTTMHFLYKKGKFRPPWLWSIVEVLKQLHDYKKRIILDEFSDEPRPIALPCNCDQCTPSVLEAMSEYRKTGSFQNPTRLMCSCRQQWKKQLESSQ